MDDEGEATDGSEPATEVEEDDAGDGDGPPAELVDRVESADAATVAAELAALHERAADAETALADCREEVDELESRLKHKQADFENYKKRMDRRREQERRRATEDLVERLLDVRDNLARAVEQDADADVRGGVETTLRQFDDVLEAEDVTPIEPSPGDAVDPQRHEVLMRVESDEATGTVHEVHRAGYEMADTVLRPAQVTVSDDE